MARPGGAQAWPGLRAAATTPVVVTPIVMPAPLPGAPAEAIVESVDWRRAPLLLNAGLTRPHGFWEGLDERRDYWPSLAVVMAAPLLASLSWPATGQGGFVGWLTAVGLGFIGALIVWVVLSAAAYLIMPFLGADLSWKRVSATLAVACAPKALGALLSAVYALAAALRPAVVAHPFSSGVDLLFGRAPASAIVSQLSRIGLIDFWSAMLAVVGLAGVARLGRGGKMKLSFTLGVAWVILGLVTAY